jgi:predicted transcriptional regulator
MTRTAEPRSAPILTLCAESAADLMKPSPVSIRDNATIAEAIAVLSDKGFSAAPVIDEAGHPVGVVSRSDIIIHQRERINQLTSSTSRASADMLTPETDRARVSDIMTPAVFAVTAETQAAQVVAQLLALNVHRLFVVDRSGILVGVITTLDVLRSLQ